MGLRERIRLERSIALNPSEEFQILRNLLPPEQRQAVGYHLASR